MLSIGEVASRSGLKTSAIRYYEAQGLLRPAQRHAGRRVYPASILERLAVIELAKVAGFELQEIRALLSNVDGSEPAEAWKQLVSAKAVEIDEQVKRLLEVKDLLSKLKACTCATLEECGSGYIEARSRYSPDGPLHASAPLAIIKRR